MANSGARVAGVAVHLPGLVKRREMELKVCLEKGTDSTLKNETNHAPRFDADTSRGCVAVPGVVPGQ